MGYHINLTEADFRIDAENTRDALDTIRELMADPSADRHGYSAQSGRHFSWLNNATPEDWDSLQDAMADWRFPVELDDDQNVVDIRFSGQKIGDENQLFDVIAPYVEDGSYLEFRGEDGDVWRLVFDDDSVEEVQDTTKF